MGCDDIMARRDFEVKTDYILSIFLFVFGFSAILYSSVLLFPYTQGGLAIGELASKLSKSIPLASVGTAFLVVGYLELRFFSETRLIHHIEKIVEEEEKLLEESIKQRESSDIKGKAVSN